MVGDTLASNKTPSCARASSGGACRTSRSSSKDKGQAPFEQRETWSIGEVDQDRAVVWNHEERPGRDALNELVKSQGKAQKNFIDPYASSTAQLRTLQNGLLSRLSMLKNDSQDSQIQAALILFQMKVTPVVVVHIDFGGDNHSDVNLSGEIAGHKSGMATLTKMMDALTAANLKDRCRPRALIVPLGRVYFGARSANLPGPSAG
jgi:hypothetical protein